ncbi:hypothetical protein B9479_005612 [Cryptococcus floricola]|uniref:N-acetyltransferase domain-containing protein n=1 Tax=Cryptococcus floricola TaxID=2591691 RepID=A0A5D3ASG6_9TREE|nr:hypothetical protein B9479_005612 [Cryptococcus floricola]
MAVYTNTYAPTPPPAELPRDIHLHTKPEEYDFNFIFPVKLLKSDKVVLKYKDKKLITGETQKPSLHAELYLEGVSKYPELFKWIPAFPAKTLEEALVFIEKHWRQPSNTLSYAIFTEPPGSTNKVESEDYVYAGSIAVAGCSEEQMMAEVGYVTVLPPFHRTHVHTHATGLLLHYILDLPSQGGLGLRRCQWLCNSLNEPSKSAALRMGFKHEGVQKAKRVLSVGKEGARRGRKGEGVKREECDVRDDWVSGLVWDEWEHGVKENVDGLMARKG